MGTSKRKRKVFQRLGHVLREGVRLKLADGYYRVRRGRLVRIPDKWVGRPEERCGDKFWRKYMQLRRPRQSKVARKLRMKPDAWGCKSSFRVPRDRYERAKKKGREYGYGGGGGHPRNWAPRHLSSRRRRQLHEYEDE